MIHQYRISFRNKNNIDKVVQLYNGLCIDPVDKKKVYYLIPNTGRASIMSISQFKRKYKELRKACAWNNQNLHCIMQINYGMIDYSIKDNKTAPNCLVFYYAPKSLMKKKTIAKYVAELIADVNLLGINITYYSGGFKYALLKNIRSIISRRNIHCMSEALKKFNKQARIQNDAFIRMKCFRYNIPLIEIDNEKEIKELEVNKSSAEEVLQGYLWGPDTTIGAKSTTVVINEENLNFASDLMKEVPKRG